MRGPKSRQVAAINDDRDRELDAGIDVGGVLYYSDETFLLELVAMITGYELGLLSGTQAIRAMDNSIHQLDQAQLVQLGGLIGARRQTIYAASWAAKDALP